jgi:hypothetical protein
MDACPSCGTPLRKHVLADGQRGFRQYAGCPNADCDRGWLVPAAGHPDPYGPPPWASEVDHQRRRLLMGCAAIALVAAAVANPLAVSSGREESTASAPHTAQQIDSYVASVEDALSDHIKDKLRHASGVTPYGVLGGNATCKAEDPDSKYDDGAPDTFLCEAALPRKDEQTGGELKVVVDGTTAELPDGVTVRVLSPAECDERFDCL